MDNDILKFIRQKNYRKLQDLGRGGLGEAILIKDEEIDKVFVCKKYLPINGIKPDDYFNNFIQEIKLMFDANNTNIIRIYNYYLYPEYKTGFIIMEYVEGDIISKYLSENTENINSVFEQVINAFKYLENNHILHRDIRDTNIMVTKEGIVKIIDFGFGKKIEYEADKFKSISLNWWCDIPDEFESELYDEKTEIYFIGKLFEQIIKDYSIESFIYNNELRSMIVKDPKTRVESFNSISDTILTKSKLLDSFTDIEKITYRNFAEGLCNIIKKIESQSRYIELPITISKLELVYQQNMLEQSVQNTNEIARAFISGPFYIRPTFDEFTVYTLKEFIDLLKRINNEKQKILIMNIQNRLNNIERYSNNIPPDFPDDIPF